MLKTFEIKLDIEKVLYQPTSTLFNISTDDLDTIELQFEITQDDAAFDLTGTTVELAIKKPSGLVVYQICEITDALNGKAAARLTNQAYIEFGVHTAELYLRSAEQIAITSPFYYMSREAILSDDSLESINEWSAFQEALFSMDKKPILVEGVPTAVPEYVGQMAFDTLGKKAFIANDTTAQSWQLLAASEETGTAVVYWADIINKPTEFPAAAHTHLWAEIIDKPASFPADAHTHLWADITDKPASFPAEAHTHLWADVTDKPTEFPAEAHTHTAAEITDFGTAVGANIPAEYVTETEGDSRYSRQPSTGTTDPSGAPLYIGQIYVNTTTSEAWIAKSMAGAWERLGRVDSLDWANITNKPASFPAEAHTHLWADITDKPATFTPSAHTHLWADITDKPTTFTPSAHTHTKADITDFAHNHTKADITDFAHTHLWADITDKPAEFPAEAHSHAITDITNLDTTLEGKDEKPITGAGAPTIVPAYVGQIYIDTTAGEAYIADGTTAANWQTITKDELEAHTHLWADITDKPTTFPPDAHNHTKADITDFAHTHLWADVTDKPTEFPPPLAAVDVVGGHRVGNGLTMAGEYLTVRSGNGLVTNGADSYAVEIDRTTTDAWYVQNAAGMDLTLWKGTQAEYDAIATKDPNTIYFIV